MTISKKYKNSNTSNLRILQSAFDDISISDANKVGDSLTGDYELSKTQSGGNYVNNNIHTDATPASTQATRGKKAQAIRVKKKIPLIDTTKLLTQ
jgi:hypothetical protein